MEKYYPSTLNNTHVCARLSNGEVVEGEANISRSYEKKKKITELFLKNKNSKINPDCVSEIQDADLIVIGPGGLYTSLIVNLLPKGMRDAIKKSKARKVYVSNAATQAGVTDDLDLYMHVREIEKYLGKGILDYVVVNGKPPEKKLIKRYEKAGSKYLFVTDEQIDKISKIVKKVVVNDLIMEDAEEEYGKPLYIRHDPRKLANSIIGLARKKVKGVILVAGKGSRMKPFSIKESKEMIRFYGKPLIAHHADEMIANGIEEIIFICNDENIDSIRNYIKKEYVNELKKRNGSVKNINFNFILQTEQKGPVNALLYARSFLENDYFIVKYGDSIASTDQTHDILDKFNQDPLVDCVATLRKVKRPEEYGIAKFKDGKLIGIIEKPKKIFHQTSQT
jgi:choline kinase